MGLGITMESLENELETKLQNFMLRRTQNSIRLVGGSWANILEKLLPTLDKNTNKTMVIFAKDQNNTYYLCDAYNKETKESQIAVFSRPNRGLFNIQEVERFDI